MPSPCHPWTRIRLCSHSLPPDRKDAAELFDYLLANPLRSVNRFIERLWRSLKYEDIYLRSYEHGLDLRRGVGNWFGDYNENRPHQALGYATPAEAYYAPESHGAKPASWA